MSSTSDPSHRPTYTKPQLSAYLSTIHLPEPHLSSPIFSSPSLARTLTHGLPLLTALQKHTLASIPFENLTLHYKPLPAALVEPCTVHQRSVAAACGRGGHCLENNLLFYTVLFSLGFSVSSVAGRVYETPQSDNDSEASAPRPGGWNHRITIVHFDDDDEDKKRSFLADVGFGALGPPTRPYELLKNDLDPEPILNIPPFQESRLRWTCIPELVDRDQRLWVYETKFRPDGQWTPTYCFTETEFLPADYEMMTFFINESPRSWFTFRMVCVKMLLGKARESDGSIDAVDGEEEVIVGDVSLVNDVVKRRLYGKSEVVERLETEEQRVRALKKWFGITITDAQIEGIKGMPTALS